MTAAAASRPSRFPNRVGPTSTPAQSPVLTSSPTPPIRRSVSFSAIAKRRPAGRVILLYASYPLAPIGFAVGVRYRTDPARDFPVADQRHEIGKVVIAVCSHSQPLGFR